MRNALPVAAHLRLVAGLGFLTSPASAQERDRAFVPDARHYAFGNSVTNGGSAACPVYYDGMSWVAG